MLKFRQHRTVNYTVLPKFTGNTIGAYFIEAVPTVPSATTPSFTEFHIIHWDRTLDLPRDVTVLTQVDLQDGLFLKEGIDPGFDNVVFAGPRDGIPKMIDDPVGVQKVINDMVVEVDAPSLMRIKYAEYEGMRFEKEAFEKFVSEYDTFESAPNGKIIKVVGGTGGARDHIGVEGQVIAMIQAQYTPGTMRTKLGITQNGVRGQVKTQDGRSIAGYPDAIWVWQHNCQPKGLIGKDQATFAKNAMKIGKFAHDQAATFAHENQQRVMRIEFQPLTDTLIGRRYLLARQIKEKPTTQIALDEI